MKLFLLSAQFFTLIWLEYNGDLMLPIRHLGDNAELVIIKNAGHAINAEKPKELYKHFKSFLIDPLPPAKPGNYSNGRKTD